METNFYMLNHQKVLFVARELHKRGFENLRIVPSLSPSGLSWRCSFITIVNREEMNVFASLWLQSNYEYQNKEIELNIEELTDNFMKKERNFLENCRGKNEEYVKWFGNILQKLEPEELPYAFADYFSPTSYWKTSLGNQIDTIPGEEKYYFGY